MGPFGREVVRVFSLVSTAALFLFCGTLWGEDPKEEWAARQVYLEDCAGCHGYDRTGFIGVPLIPSYLNGLSEAGIRSLIRDGVLDTLMPAWKCRLREDDLRLLARYFKVIRPETQKEIRIKPDGSLEVIQKANWWEDSKRVEKGNSLFTEYCMGCHHPEIEAFAPSYRKVAGERDIRVIVGQIKFPHSNSKILGYAEQTMPKFDLTDEEIKNLGAYVGHFRIPEK